MAIHWPLVSSAVFAGEVECNPPGMGRGGSESAAALWISVEVWGLENGCGREWTPGPLCRNHSQRNRPRKAPPRCSEKLGGQEARPGLNAGKGLAWGKGPSSSQLVRPARTDPRRAPAYRRGAPTPCWKPRVSVHSLRTCPSPSHHPTPIHFYDSLLPHPAFPIHSFTPPGRPPHLGPPATAPALDSSGSPDPPVPGPRRSPHRPEGRGTKTTHRAAQPRPFTHGRGVALTQPQHLTSCLCHPLRPI